MNKKDTAIPRILLLVIILVQIGITTHFFFFVRQGLFIDEIWCYGLANSVGKPHFSVKPGVHVGNISQEALDNYYEWIDGKKVNDYITVQKGEQFDLIGVYKNMTLDYHPFLFFWLLNAVSSLTPDKFSLVPMFITQMILLAVTQVFLYKAGKLAFKDKKYMPLVLCLFYALGMGGMDTFAFIRQYSLLTMLVVMHFYFQIKFIRSEDLSIKKHMFPIALTGLLGLITQYNMIAVAFGTTLAVCIYLFFKRKFKKMFAYGFSMVGAVASFLIVWPAFFKHLGSTGGAFETYPFETTFKFTLSETLKAVSGISFSAMRDSGYAYVIAFLVILTAVCAPLCYLFRNEKWFISFKNGAAEKCKSLYSKRSEIIDYSMVVSLFAIIVYISVVALTMDFFRAGDFFIRYLFSIMPLICFELIGILEAVISFIPYVKKITVPLILSFSVVSAAVSHTNPNILVIRQPGDMTHFDAAKVLAGKDVQLAGTVIGLPISTAHILKDANKLKFFECNWYRQHKDEFDPELDDFYFILVDNYHLYNDCYQENYLDIVQPNIEPEQDTGDANVGLSFEDTSEEAAQRFFQVVSGYDVYSFDEEWEMLTFFNTGKYKAEWVGDLSVSYGLLKIIHVTRNDSAGTAAGTE